MVTKSFLLHCGFLLIVASSPGKFSQIYKVTTYILQNLLLEGWIGRLDTVKTDILAIWKCYFILYWCFTQQFLISRFTSTFVIHDHWMADDAYWIFRLRRIFCVIGQGTRIRILLNVHCYLKSRGPILRVTSSKKSLRLC